MNFQTQAGCRWNLGSSQGPWSLSMVSRELMGHQHPHDLAPLSPRVPWLPHCSSRCLLCPSTLMPRSRFPSPSAPLMGLCSVVACFILVTLSKVRPHMTEMQLLVTPLALATIFPIMSMLWWLP